MLRYDRCGLSGGFISQWPVALAFHSHWDGLKTLHSKAAVQTGRGNQWDRPERKMERASYHHVTSGILFLTRITGRTSTRANWDKGIAGNRSVVQKGQAAAKGKAKSSCQMVLKSRSKDSDRDWLEGKSSNAVRNSIMLSLQSTSDFSKQLWSSWVEESHLPLFKALCSVPFPSYRYWSSKKK